MKERPIIFSTDMVKAIIEDRKTQTRRVIKPQPDVGLDPFDSYSHIETGYYHPTMRDKDGEEYPGDEIFGAFTDDGEWGWKCPYGGPGDRLWVREMHYRWTGCGSPPSDFIRDRCYRDNYQFDSLQRGCCLVTVPSLHMPRWASRILLEITEVRAERLQEISFEDVIAEGLDPFRDCPGVNYPTREARWLYAELWNSINAKHGWDKNEWVGVITFQLFDKEEVPHGARVG